MIKLNEISFPSLFRYGPELYLLSFDFPRAIFLCENSIGKLQTLLKWSRVQESTKSAFSKFHFAYARFFSSRTLLRLKCHSGKRSSSAMLTKKKHEKISSHPCHQRISFSVSCAPNLFLRFLFAVRKLALHQVS